MARPRAFDEIKALDAAMTRFWRYGLEASSVRNLAVEMGLNDPSLYNTFGDKRTLFAKALERYAVCFLRERIDRLEQHPSPKAAICAFFEELIARSLADPDQRGCLIINSALEVGPHDCELRGVVCGYLAEIEGFFHGRLKHAKGRGEIPECLPVDDMARLLLGMVLGLRVAARVSPEPALLKGMISPVLALLDTSHPTPKDTI